MFVWSPLKLRALFPCVCPTSLREGALGVSPHGFLSSGRRSPAAAPQAPTISAHTLLGGDSELVLKLDVTGPSEGCTLGPSGKCQRWGKDPVKPSLLVCLLSPILCDPHHCGLGAVLTPWRCVLQEAVAGRPDRVPQPALQGPPNGVSSSWR